MAKDKKLTIEIEGDELVIRIGVDTLAHEAQNSDDFYTLDDLGHGTIQYVVVDNTGFAQSVIKGLVQIAADGHTDVEYAIKQATLHALENDHVSIDGREIEAFEESQA